MHRPLQALALIACFHATVSHVPDASITDILNQDLDVMTCQDAIGF